MTCQKTFCKFIIIIFAIFSASCEQDTKTNSTISKNKKTDRQVKETKTTSPQKSLIEFTNITGETIGIDFKNILQESEQLNIFTYEYLYNGAGVAAGDVNNDGLIDLFFCGNMESSQLYLNQGNFQFKNISEEANVMTRNFNSGASMLDINNDGWLDIYVCNTLSTNNETRKNKLFINNQNGTFTEQSAQYGLDDNSYSTQSYQLDYDADGDLDLYLVNHRIDLRNASHMSIIDNNGKLSERTPESLDYISDKLYRNNGNNTFTDVSSEAGIKNYSFGLSAAIGDYNNDGYPDIFVGNDFISKDNLFINNKNGTFSDKLDKYLGHSSLNSMGSDFADINNDGLNELMTLDMVTEDVVQQKMLKGADPYDKYQMLLKVGKHHQVMKNTLHVNNGNSFSEISGIDNLSHTDWSWGVLFADLNNNGLKDILVGNGIAKDITNIDFANYSSPHFVNRNQSSIPFMELVNQLPVRQQQNYIYTNEGNFNFKKSQINISCNSNGMICADLDNDGDLDIVYNNINQKVLVQKNETNPTDYIKVRLIGNDKNKLAIGSKLKLISKGQIQTIDAYQSRGFLSSQPFEYIFKANIGDTLIINWPDKKQSEVIVSKTGTQLVLDYNNLPKTKEKKAKSFYAFEETQTLNFTHKENDYNDFNLEPLLNHQYSKAGPCIAVGDLNNDALPDIYIGNSKGAVPSIFFQNSAGKFDKQNISILNKFKEFEDTDAVIFDFNNDGYNDLYIVSGGNEYKQGNKLYQDRLLINNKGNFEQVKLPEIVSSGKTVTPFDYNNDGFLDLFVGANINTGKMPLSPKSYILKNDQGNGFIDVSNLLENNSELGMIHCSALLDIDNDNQKELVIAGEWMAIKYIKFDGRRFTIKNLPSNKELSGWWQSIHFDDLDNDGDQDFIAGNWGLNAYHKATDGKPATIFYGDFDKNGSIDAIDCYITSNQNISYPRVLRDPLGMHLPPIRKLFKTYESFAKTNAIELKNKLATLNNISPNELKTASFESVIGINENGNFKIKSLPKICQSGPINDITTDEINGIKYLFIAGNFAGTNQEEGRFDATQVRIFEVQDGIQLKERKINLSNPFAQFSSINNLKVKGKKSLIIGINNEQPKLIAIKK